MEDEDGRRRSISRRIATRMVYYFCYQISNLGYKSVAHYLIQTRRADLNSEKNEKTGTQTKWSLPFLSEKVEPEDGVAKSDNMKFEDSIAINEKPEAHVDEREDEDEDENKNKGIKSEVVLSEVGVTQNDQILDLKDKNMELEEIDSEDGVPTNNACKVENPTKLQSSPVLKLVDKATNPEELKLKVNNLEDTICISALNGCGLDEFCNAVHEKLKDSMVWAMAELDALLWEGRKQKLARAPLCPHIAPPVGVGGSFGSILQFDSDQHGGQVVVDFMKGLMGKMRELNAHQVVRQAPDKQKEQSSFDAATVANKEDAAYSMVSNQPVQDQFRVPSLVTSDSPKLFELSSRFAKRKRTPIEDSRTSQLLLDTETIATTTGGAPQCNCCYSSLSFNTAMSSIFVKRGRKSSQKLLDVVAKRNHTDIWRMGIIGSKSDSRVGNGHLLEKDHEGIGLTYPQWWTMCGGSLWNLLKLARKISSWWNVDYVDVSSYEEWYTWLVSLRLQANLKAVFEGIFYCLWWSVWMFRNKILFEKDTPSQARIFDNIVSNSYYWLSTRNIARKRIPFEFSPATYPGISIPRDKSPGNAWILDVYIPFKKSKAGRFRLHANSVRFQREQTINTSSSNNSQPRKNVSVRVFQNSFADVLKSGKVNPHIENDPSLVIVLDDSCRMERDFSCTLMGKIKDINTLSNLYVILANEGFEKVKLSYLGGQWVLLDMYSTISKEKITKHVGVGSWFEELKPACNSFVCEDRIGELVDVNESEIPSLLPNRIRVKKLEAWSPKFITKEEDNLSSDEECEEGNNDNDIGLEQGNEYDRVSETSFAQGDDNEYRKDSNSSRKPVTSEDPFGIYKILKRNKETSKVESADPQYPLGFTPDVVEENAVENRSGKTSKPNNTDKVMCDHGSKFQAGGSILEVMDDLIKKGFNKLVEETWKKSDHLEPDSIIKLKKKLQALKSFINQWLSDDKQKSNAAKHYIHNRLSILDTNIDQRRCTEEMVNERSNLLKELQDLNAITLLDMTQKAKIRWVIEGDENSKFFHRIINKIRSRLAIRGVLVKGDWIIKPSKVKNEFLKHFTNRFAEPATQSLTFESPFPKRLSSYQNKELERLVSYDEIKRAVWDCGTNKSPGPDGFTFEFYRRIEAGIPPLSLSIYYDYGKLALSITWCMQGSIIADSLSLSHLFYADDVVFVGKWSLSNLSTIVKNVVISAARSIGCSTFHMPFTYLRVKVGGIMSRLNSWEDVVAKLTSRLSKWKLKMLSIGGRLTLIKLVLSSLTLYYMSSFKVLKVFLVKWNQLVEIFSTEWLWYILYHNTRSILGSG
ncbi:hypothetical protein Tco_0382713 [Tanacetum coccineum]